MKNFRRNSFDTLGRYRLLCSENGQLALDQEGLQSAINGLSLDRGDRPLMIGIGRFPIGAAAYFHEAPQK